MAFLAIVKAFDFRLIFWGIPYNSANFLFGGFFLNFNVFKGFRTFSFEICVVRSSVYNNSEVYIDIERISGLISSLLSKGGRGTYIAPAQSVVVQGVVQE